MTENNMKYKEIPSLSDFLDIQVDYDEIENEEIENIYKYKIEAKTNKLEKYNVIFKGYYFAFFVCVISLLICLLPYFYNGENGKILTYIIDHLNNNWSNPNFLAINISITWSFIFISIYILYSWAMILLITTKYKNVIPHQWYTILLLIFGLGFLSQRFLHHYYYDNRLIIRQMNVLKILLIFQVVYSIFLITELVFLNSKTYFIIYGLLLGGFNIFSCIRISSTKWVIKRLNNLKFILIPFTVFMLPYIGNIIFSIYGLIKGKKQINWYEKIILK